MHVRQKLQAADDLKARIMSMDERAAIKDPVMLKKSLAVLACVVAGFMFHGVLHLQPATVALAGGRAAAPQSPIPGIPISACRGGSGRPFFSLSGFLSSSAGL
jgi:hypothetical protein